MNQTLNNNYQWYHRHRGQFLWDSSSIYGLKRILDAYVGVGEITDMQVTLTTIPRLSHW